MTRVFLLPGLLSGIIMIVWLWALVDVITTDSLLIRNMQKSTWIFLVLFVPTIGAAAWVLFGRPEGASLAPGGYVPYDQNPYRSERRAIGPEDSSDWSRNHTRSRPALPSATSATSAGNQAADDTESESLAIRERKLMEKEAELAKREAELQAAESQAAESQASAGLDIEGEIDDPAAED